VESVGACPRPNGLIEDKSDEYFTLCQARFPDGKIPYLTDSMELFNYLKKNILSYTILMSG